MDEDLQKPKDNEALPAAVPLVQEQKNAKEIFYDKIPVTIKTLDFMIKLLVAALVVALAVGFYLGNFT